MYVCLCRGITDQDIKDAVANGAESYREIRELLVFDCAVHLLFNKLLAST